MSQPAPVFDPPGPGHWELDRSHMTGGTTPIVQWLMSDSIETAFRALWATQGIPAETLSVRFVHGFVYTRLRPLVAPDRPGAKAPPDLVTKLASRIHPEFRRRAKAARRTLASSPAGPVIEEWRRTTRPRLVARNLELQDVALVDLDDHGLARHIEEVITHLRWTFEEHFRLHGYDLGPIGQLIMAGRDWGLTGGELVPALAGASPSTAAPLEALAEIRAGIAAAGIEPSSLDDVAAASPETAAQLAAYLRHRGAVLYAGYDLDTPTLGEAPHVVLTTIMSDTTDRVFDHDAHSTRVDALRLRVPDVDHERFDALLHDAREAMDLRDDNGPITAEWPLGLLRLAMLEAGNRLAGARRLLDPEHVFELDRDELPALVRGAAAPDAAETASRAERRTWERGLTPPRTLGPVEAAPSLSALPAPLAQMVGLVQMVMAEMGMAEHSAAEEANEPRLSGTGVGSTPASGRARMAETASEAFDKIEAGDILVTRTTSPAFNMVLGLVGGLVTAEGGPMSHAAVLSRELNIAAVVGAPDAMEAIADGDIIEVDPVAGVVRIVAHAHQPTP